MTQETLVVEGMTCQHCVQTITEALNNIKGTNTVVVELDKKEVNIDFNVEETNLKEITDKIIEVGFELAES
ncbi:MAG: heavy-metal-associated domain-containing protein [Nitrospina sp.]|jgi:copper chaperone|nr:heavy-metal-associated domain-containing protein [Nitrospina sp.]MBT6718719.1 heavy-metal-associated domain-containing protein [Nitrospina sp.]